MASTTACLTVAAAHQMSATDEQGAHAPLSLTTLLEDARDYEREVLGLDSHRTEQDLEEQCIQDAQDSGIEIQTSASSSLNTVSTSPPRRSPSSDSHRSCSTGLTNYSRNSAEHHYLHPYALRFHSMSRPSLYDLNFDEPASPINPKSHSSISLTPSSPLSSRVSLSLTSGSPRKPFSVRRGLGRFSKLKRSSTSVDDLKECICNQCCDTGGPQLGPFFRFACQHNICRPHLRQLVVRALKSGQRCPPQCCGQPIPRIAVQAVTREDEEEKLYPPSGHLIGSGLSSTSLSTLGGRRETDDRGRRKWSHKDNGASYDHVAELVSEETQRNLRCAMADSNYKALRRRQEAERDQFVAFKTRQREALGLYHSVSRTTRLKDQAKAALDLQDEIPLVLAKLEDKHVTAEIDLREAQKQDKRNCFLALRHMQAYCSGQGPEGVGRTVTEQDRKELERQRWQCDNIDHRHEAAINVLREQQARQMRICTQKQDSDISMLEKKHESERADFENTCNAEVQELEDLFSKRKQRLVRRWDLAAEIWKKRQADDGILELPFPLAPVEWPTATLIPVIVSPRWE